MTLNNFFNQLAEEWAKYRETRWALSGQSVAEYCIERQRAEASTQESSSDVKVPSTPKNDDTLPL